MYTSALTAFHGTCLNYSITALSVASIGDRETGRAPAQFRGRVMSNQDRRHSLHSRPVCPKCNGEMWLMMAKAFAPRQLERSYRCPSCRMSITLSSESTQEAAGAPAASVRDICQRVL